MTDVKERYIVTVSKVPPERRDAFRSLPEEQRASYEEVHPGEVGQQVSYSLDLTEEDLEKVRHAENLINVVRISNFGLGYRRYNDPRAEDYPVAAALRNLPVETPTPRKDRYWDRGPILDQGTEGACTGFSARAFLNALPVMTPPDSGPSAHEIYLEAQKMDEWEGENYSGSSVNAACKVLRSYGYINEYYWAESFEEIRDWLLYRGGVIFGLDWYEGCYQPNAHNYIRPTGQLVGGHAILARGIHVDGWILLQNSWGPGYGWNGVQQDYARQGETWLWKDDLVNVFMKSSGFCAACTLQVK